MPADIFPTGYHATFTPGEWHSPEPGTDPGGGHQGHRQQGERHRSASCRRRASRASEILRVVRSRMPAHSAPRAIPLYVCHAHELRVSWVPYLRRRPLARVAMGRLIGSVSLAVGSALAVAPRPSSRALGLPHSSRWTPILGAADAALGVALLDGYHLRRWMHVRALANLGLAAVYATHLKVSAHLGRTRAGMLAMALITVTDGALARTLPRD